MADFKVRLYFKNSRHIVKKLIYIFKNRPGGLLKMAEFKNKRN